MLTFDNSLNPGGGELEALTVHSLPDIIEIGETNDYWLHVRRSTRMIEFTSKQTGQVVAKCVVSDAAVLEYGLSSQQVDAARRGLKL
jgi:hypothetical protein